LLGTLKLINKTNVIIVDSSDSQLDYEADLFQNFGRFKVLRTGPGLPTQRNIGLEESASALVVFLDDDVELQENFVEETINHFNENVSCDGLGYLLQDVTLTTGSKFNDRIQGLTMSKFGQVSKSGRNLWYPTLGSRENFLAPMWIPGCAMSFRRRAISDLTFESRLEKGVLKGYALGEDVDFTLKIIKRGGKLELCTSSLVNHYEAPGERDRTRELAVAQGAWLRYLTQVHTEYVSLPRVMVRLVAESIYLGLSVLKDVSRKSSLKNSLLKLASFSKTPPYGI
jgi:GT2 family glycosyltransferase